MLLTWKDDFVIDHGIIDEDHQFLFRKINTVIRRLSHNLPVALIAETVRQLRNFASLHFQREERLQASVDYPGLAEHRVEHQALLAALDRVLEQLTTHRDDEVISDPNELKTFFYDWMLGHIIGSDRRIAPFVGPTRGIGEHSLASLGPAEDESPHWRDRAFR